MSYIDDLRQGSFISPMAAVHLFRFDDLSRTGGKKVAIGEILDSNEGAAQDQGNNPHVFSMDIYFVGDNYHEAADAFWDSLSEKYTSDSAGLLKHPRWGDVSVMPVSWTQSESFISGAGVGKFSVEFRRVYKTSWPKLNEEVEASALSDIESLKDSSLGGIKTKITALANLAGKVKNTVGIIINTAKDIAALSEALISEIEDIQNSINRAIDDIGSSITSVISSAQYLMSLPARIVDETLDKINGYKKMVDDLINGIDSPNEQSNDNKINNAILTELLVGYAVGAMAEAALFTDFQTRTGAEAGLKTVRGSYDAFLTAIEKSRVSDQVIDKTYQGDYDFLSVLGRVISKTQTAIVNKSFQLKAERRKVLSVPSDAISLCAEYYNSVDNETINFFCQTNRLIGDEFINIPAGREIVFYA
jgi:hypothetical protein